MTWLSQLFSAASQPFQWWVIVAPWEQALRIRRGKTAKLLGPGMHFRIPFLDRVYRQSLRKRVVTDTGQTVTTKDGKVVTVAIAATFEVSDLLKLYGALANPEVVLLTKIQSRVTAHVAATDAADLSPTSIERAGVPDSQLCRDWGIASVELAVIGFAFVQTYRLLMNDYRTLSGLDVDAWDGKVQAPR